MQETLEEGLMQLFRSNPVIRQNLADLERKVLAGEITAVRAGRELLSLYVQNTAMRPPETSKDRSSS